MELIVIPLPFSLSKSYNINPYTFEYEYTDHPVLEIGSSNSVLKWEVMRWLRKHEIAYTFCFHNNEYSIQFPNEKDATMFCLRWL